MTKGRSHLFLVLSVMVCLLTGENSILKVKICTTMRSDNLHSYYSSKNLLPNKPLKCIRPNLVNYNKL